jgi:hypothetical protein
MFDSLANSEGGGIPIEDALHIGKVVHNNDPLMLQRIKVTVPGFLDGQDTEGLPWVGPMHPSEFGMNEKYGVVRVPLVGSLVVVKFQGGDVHHGMYVGYVPTSNFAKNLPGALKTNYPNRVGYIDPMGTVVYTDVTTGEMTVNHFAGSIVTFEPTGKMIKIISNLDITGDIHHVGNLKQEGNTTQSGNYDLAGNNTISGNNDVGGNETVGGSLTVSGAAKLGSISSPTGVVGGKSLEGHTHTDSRGGGTSQPI